MPLDWASLVVRSFLPCLPPPHLPFNHGAPRVVNVAAANGNAPCGWHSSSYRHADPLIDCIWLSARPSASRCPLLAKSAARKTRNRANIVLNTQRDTLKWLLLALTSISFLCLGLRVAIFTSHPFKFVYANCFLVICCFKPTYCCSLFVHLE